MKPNIACGIAGWSYADWEGYVYPPGLKDKLRFIAGFFDVIEINTTFYRPPVARMVDSWLRRTEDLPGFFFTAKIHRDVTHHGRIEPETVDAFRHGFASMLAAGRLRHLLAQFRYDFRDLPRSREHLERVRDAFGNMTNLTLELRHNSWQAPGALEFLRSLGVTVANLDYPTGRDSFNLPLCDLGEHAYLRLHGRNRQAWFSRDAGRDETYNYRYREKELDEIVERAVKLAAMSKSLTLVANNHYQGKEALNALELKAKVTGNPVPVPPLLAEHYPEARRIARDTGGPSEPHLLL